jgi:hypothetical protein
LLTSGISDSGESGESGKVKVYCGPWWYNAQFRGRWFLVMAGWSQGIFRIFSLEDPKESNSVNQNRGERVTG